MTLYRRRSDVGPDHFVIMHKESDGRDLSTKGAWEWNIEHHQRAGRSLPQWGTSEPLGGAMAALKACWESADVPIKWPPGHAAALERHPDF